MPLVSIIATFFDLENYATKCIRSILNQSFENIEVMLVDDGSSDGTAVILDAFASDDRVKVIHTENHGPGAARNTGIRAATGDWVMFVDGDDYLYPWSVELLLHCVLTAGAPLAVGKYNVIVDGNDDYKLDSGRDFDVKLLVDRAVADALLLEEVTESPCAKIIRAGIAKSHPFPEGSWYEDVMWAPELYLACDLVAVIDVPVYAYVMRAGSVVHRKRGQLKQAQDFLRATDAMTGALEQAYPDSSVFVAYRRALELSRLHALLKTIEDEPDVIRMDEECLREIKALVPRFKGDGRIPVAKRMRIELIAKAPGVHDLALHAYERFVKGRGGARS